MSQSFMRRAVAILAVTGLVVTGGVAIPAHQVASAAGPVTITFWNGPDTTGTVPKLIANFNSMKSGKIKVVLQTQAADTGTYFKNIQRALQAGSATPDIFAGDVIWPAQLAAANLIAPLDQYFPLRCRQISRQARSRTSTYNGKLYGMPWFTDFGLIYYRKDLLQKYQSGRAHNVGAAAVRGRNACLQEGRQGRLRLPGRPI